MGNRLKLLEYGSFALFVIGALLFLLLDKGYVVGTILLVLAIIMRKLYLRALKNDSEGKEDIIDDMDHEG